MSKESVINKLTDILTSKKDSIEMADLVEVLPALIAWSKKKKNKNFKDMVKKFGKSPREGNELLFYTEKILDGIDIGDHKIIKLVQNILSDYAYSKERLTHELSRIDEIFGD